MEDKADSVTNDTVSFHSVCASACEMPSFWSVCVLARSSDIV